MNSKFLAVLCLVLCAEAFAVRELTGTASKALLQDQQAVARATGSVTQIGQGTTQGSARAFASSFAESQFDFEFRRAVSIARAGDRGTAVAVARAAARAFAVAVARAFAFAAVRIVSDNAGGSGCVRASANARASARAAAVAVVRVLAQASNDINFADASAAATAIVEVTVSAFAAARARACVNGVGQASAVASQLSQAIGVVFADVAAFALARVDANSADAFIVVRAEAGKLVFTIDRGFVAARASGGGSAGASRAGGAGETSG